MSERLESASQLVAPLLLIVAVGIAGGFFGPGTEEDFISALVAVTIVVALHVFIGNSGVISFGHISFVALGAFAAGLMTIPAAIKPTLLPELFPFLAENDIGNVESLVLAAALGALFAALTGVPLMRLSGLAAGIATFAVLEITHNVLRFWDKIGPGAKTLSLVPETTGLSQATIAALIAAVVAFLYRNSRSGRKLRASREDGPAAQAVGIDIHRQRLLAFTISGALAGLGGGLMVHQLGSVTTEQVYLDLTFLTLAMLVVGGASSLWGAVVGALSVSFLDSWLLNAENGTEIGFVELTLPNGSSIVILGVLMALMLVLRPSGITGGKEVSLGRLLRRRGTPEPASGAESSTQPLKFDQMSETVPEATKHEG
jgi:branched-chain amino acid transport system permease protein